MAQVFLRPQSDPTHEQAYQAVTLYFGDAWDHMTQCGLSLITQNVPSPSSTYHGICFYISNLSFNDGQTRYTLISDVNEASPLTDTPILGDDLERVEPYGIGDRFTVNFKDSAFEEVPYGIRPDDFYSLPYKYFVKDGLAYRALTRQAEFDPLAHYYRAKKTYKMQYNVVGTGIINFNFGFTTMFGQGPSGYGAVFSTPDDITYRISWNGDSWNWGMPGISSAQYTNFYGEFVPVSSTTSYNGPYVEVFPVAFTIPEGTNLGQYIPEKTTQYYGAIIIKYDEYAIPQSAFIEALEEKCWASPLHPHGDYGPDTPAYGGEGKTPISRDNPRNTINKAKVGGILTNPTSDKGIVIYRMNEQQFSSFIQKMTDTSLGGFSEGVLSTVIDNPLDFTGLISNAYTYLNKDTSNILFIKKSPVEFSHSETYTFSDMMVGSSALHGVSAQVVYEWYQSGTDFISMRNGTLLGDKVKVNDFTDLEPYASAELYFPMASPIQVPPSYICDSRWAVDWGFNLLDSSATYTVTIETGFNGGYIQLSTSGKCCSSAETLIAKKDTSETLESVGALISKGTSTIATGGLTAPDLVTTAAGAAMSAVPANQQMVLSNIPTSGSSIPYNDCIVGGRTEAFLTITKAERLSSGEEGRDAGREQVQGKFSNFYVSSLSEIGNENYVSVLEVKMDMNSKMTKAEYDKIIALLHEGVWI